MEELSTETTGRVVNTPPGAIACPADSRLAAIHEAAFDALLTLDEEGRIETANRAASTMFGYALEELIGAPWQRILSIENELPLESGTIPDPRGLHADGRAFPIECRVERYESDVGPRRLLVCRDLSEIHRVEERLLDIGEELKRQIGQDLHDGLGQLLTGTAFLAKALENNVSAGYQEQAKRVVELINQSINRVRSMARGLAPRHSDGRALDTVLGEVARESSAVLGVECVVECREALREVEHASVLSQVSLIAREAITNAVRHGRARRIVIELFRADGQNVMQIVDDGIGFGKGSGKVEGLGLRSMRHRARRIGGALEIAALPESGTVVRCTFR